MSVSKKYYDVILKNIKNIDFKCMDASNIKIGDFDTVVVDPPRSGLSKKVINNLLNKKCKRIFFCQTLIFRKRKSRWFKIRWKC